MIAGLHDRIQRSGRYPRILLVTCLTGMYATTFTATILTVSVLAMSAYGLVALAERLVIRWETGGQVSA